MVSFVRTMVIATLLVALSSSGAHGELRVGAHGGLSFIPASILDEAFSNAPEYLDGTIDVGAAYGFGLLEVGLQVAYLSLSTPGTVVRPAGYPPEGATYLALGMYQLSLEPTVALRFVGETFTFRIGGGVGGGYLGGTIASDEVLPDCDEPVEACGHWQSVTRRLIEPTQRWVPVVLLFGTLSYSITELLEVDLTVGLRNLPYIGMGVSLVL